MNPDIENQIKNNITWNKLSTSHKQLLGNSQKEYEKSIIIYSIKNQLRFKESLVRYVRKDEKKYYEEMLQYSQANYLLYPYHLQDMFVKGLRITPFNYYLEMMTNVIQSEKSYDTIPNFTAFDAVRLLGIGRNQYIEIMNKYRSSNNKLRLGFVSRRKPVSTLLPTQPAKILIEPWWIAQVGCISENDIKYITNEEKETIDKLIDSTKPIEAGQLNYEIVHSLYRKGLIYIEVPVIESDLVEIPPLENFVMNRCVGDNFEKLLYKLFVSVDDRTTMIELSNLLQVEIDLVLNAVSLYCRLAFAKKINSNNKKSADYDPSWKDYKTNFKTPFKPGETLLEWSTDSVKSDDSNSMTTSTSNLLISSSGNKKIGFLFDSTLTAFLMMGNLSSGLKNHAVTMFEVGKLTDQALDSFISELEKVSSDQNEGEAQRYFDHAIILKSTIQYLRYNKELSFYSKLDENSQPIENEPLGVDLLRIESLADLDEEAEQRLLAKNYSILISMAPFNTTGDARNSAPITTDLPFHFGSPIPEVNSIWFKLMLYNMIGDSPHGILIPHGKKLRKLPTTFQQYDKFEITSWGHDSAVATTSNILLTINDASAHGSILAECICIDNEIGFSKIYIAFNDTKNVLFNHPSVKQLHEKLSLEHFIGYIIMLNPFKSLNELEINFDEWYFYDLHYGVPLFDTTLNKIVLDKFKELNLGSLENMKKMVSINKKLTLELLEFIKKNQISDQKNDEYILSILSSKKMNKNTNKLTIKPTQVILFEQGDLKILD